MIGILIAIVVGSVLAVVVGVLLTPLSPLGPIRAVYHPPGVAFDWTVLGLGLLVLIVGLGGSAVAIAYRSSPANASPSEPGLVLLRTRSWYRLPPLQDCRLLVSSVSVSRFNPGQGRSAVPARSVLLGAAIAVAIVTATLTFSSGLHTLVSRPSLYGWNWNYALSSENDVPPAALTALNHDHDVLAWSGYHPLSIQIDGQTVPILLGANHAAVAPPILSGHAVDGNNQIVLGATTLSLLHRHLGDTVVGSFGRPSTAPLYLPPFKLVIVGTAALPTITLRVVEGKGRVPSVVSLISVRLGFFQVAMSGCRVGSSWPIPVKVQTEGLPDTHRFTVRAGNQRRTYRSSAIQRLTMTVCRNSPNLQPANEMRVSRSSGQTINPWVSGIPVTVEDPRGYTTTYAYNANTDLVSITDPLHNVMTYAYDGDYHVMENNQPNGGVTTYTYNLVSARNRGSHSPGKLSRQHIHMTKMAMN